MDLVPPVALNLSAFTNTSADDPSIVGSASHYNRSSPLHNGAKCDSSSLELSSNYNITPPLLDALPIHLH